MNRQQRRAATRQKPAPVDMGSVMQPIEKPLAVGDLSVKEVAELKAKNDEIEWTNAQAQHFARIAMLLGNEKIHYMREICGRRGLDLDAAQYRLDLEAGAIIKTHERMALAALPDPEPLPVEPNGSEPTEEK